MSIYKDCINGDREACRKVIELHNFLTMLRALKRIFKFPKIGPDPVPDKLISSFEEMSLEIIRNRFKGNPSPQPNKWNFIDEKLVKAGVDKKLLTESLLSTQKALASLQNLVEKDIQALQRLK